ncbi:fluoride efflux transporter CrcB [Azospirillum brasilense]|uniref:Fluoride-specific ion channel FluC n=3 Tax=Azospirillum TaxID=191 RepID=A0A6L3AXE4_AZOBR|nr:MULTISPECIES: fluoride efflux transporter CrcB [Azospirillum]MBB3266558.1 CrcB protein [Azospirillum sp. OGB3]ALJ34982.1 protein CrcB [Azospirillum brasilense]AWJ90142.1 protein CrcB [Azospirillum baldaniorum]KAA0682629.1 fluoride efflux transporter CrcB [Azospirillum brasilense]MBK3802065.1 fluoride efflux transporter CrcB [Azospirillum argentinense]
MIASPSTLAAVAVGGAVGSMARYLLMTAVGHWLGTQFPYGTLIVNAVGCFTMGALAELAALVWSPSPELRALLMVGVLGGFTTFSSFTLDVGLLVERNALPAAAGYILASMVLTIAGFFAGLAVVRSLVSVPV